MHVLTDEFDGTSIPEKPQTRRIAKRAVAPQVDSIDRRSHGVQQEPGKLSALHVSHRRSLYLRFLFHVLTLLIPV
jgi:hypothetical protein